MSEVVLPTEKQIRSRTRLLDSVVMLPAGCIAFAYLWAMVDLSRAEWRAVGLAVLGYGLLVTVVIEPLRRRLFAPLGVYLERRAAGQASLQVRREAFRAVVALPGQQMRIAVLLWISAAVLLPFLIWLQGRGGSDFGYRCLAMALTSLTGGVLSGTFISFGAKQLFTEIRETLAAEIPDPSERAQLVSRTSLTRKVQGIMVGSVVMTLGVSLTLAYARAGDSVDRMALEWQSRVLTAIAAATSPEIDPEQARQTLLPNPAVLPYPTKFSSFALTGPAGAGRDGEVSRWRETVAPAVARGVRGGELRAEAGDELVSWRLASEDRILVARTEKGASRVGFGAFRGLLGFTLIFAVVISLGMAQVLSRDLRNAVSALAGEAERMALGDLRRGRVWESEDELGDLARSFERMGGALRATVGRVAEAADRVDATAGQISAVSQSVAAASADQVRRIQQANELMMQIRQQVGEVADSAQSLNVSVEESSSSILELGAAGDELNDTASVLSAKVDEVSSSIQQMVRSVKQVGSTTERLSDAAAETSSSMEEMASAMRAVDTTAELTARISRDVVTLAESGQAKVSETMTGMEAIRDATDSAERVIRGLGGRAKEIGSILDVIDDVADETNLLALNAAIIAAQAGEQGRAFSVVADEIKELADRVLASTKEIGGLIRSVQEESENAVGAIELGTQSVAIGVERSAEAGSALEEITRASRESGNRIVEIVTAVREQTKATAHVVGLMEGVRDGVEQISVAGSEQDRGNEIVYRSAVTMQEVAQQVRRTTEEQSRGFVRIRESVEGVRSVVESINSSLQEQTQACSQVASFLEQVFDGTRSNEEAAQRMGQAMRDLATQAEALRADVAKFRV